MKIGRLCTAVFASTMVFGAAVALLHPTSVVAGGEPGSGCNPNCQAYVWCVDNVCVPSKHYTYKKAYRELEDWQCEGLFSCGLVDPWYCSDQPCGLPPPEG